MNQKLEHIVAGALGLPLEKIMIKPRPPLEIQSNRLYDLWLGGRRLVVKEYLKMDEFDDAPIREFKALQLLAPYDIAPKPSFFWPHNPVEWQEEKGQAGSHKIGPLVGYEYMDGVMWDRHKPSPKELAQLAELWLRVHAAPDGEATETLWMSRGTEIVMMARARAFMGVFESYQAWTAEVYPAGQKAAALCLGLLADRLAVFEQLEQTNPKLLFCRSDPRFANVIKRPDGRLGLVDWEDCGLRDPALDVTDLLTAPNQEDLLSDEEWANFIVPYKNGLANAHHLDDGHLMDRVHHYMAVFPIWWLSILIGQALEQMAAGEPLRPHVHELPLNERLRRYLARGLAWPDMDFTHYLESLSELVFFPPNNELS